MSRSPEALAELLEIFGALPDRAARIETLMGFADRFRGVSADVAVRPYPEENRVAECESQAFIWATPRGDGTLQFHFAVENPQGVAAMATAVILEETLSGAPPDDVAALDPEFIYEVFGPELSMGKRMGLLGMVNRVRELARRTLP